MFLLKRQCILCNKNLYNRLHIKRHCISTKTELASAYSPREVESLAPQPDYFQTDFHSQENPYSLVLPPPNVTGNLHLGHALTASIQDVLVKWNQLHGISTMWVPGLDHAGIATQVAVEKKIWKEKGLNRHQIGRDKFQEEVLKWKEEKALKIFEQLKQLNVSLNWDKATFTMDEQHCKAVNMAFIKLFEQDLIYRADHLVNWSCALQSAISDIEVDHIDVKGPTDISVPGYEQPVKFGILTRFQYKLEGSEDGVIVATTRPETILGDVALAVNPNDSRYANLIGKRVVHPFRDETIPIIADEFVDASFGSGVVKITPAHDPIDFAVGQKHNFKPLKIIDENGLICASSFTGLKRFDARDAILNQLMEKHLLRSNEPHNMRVPICSRSKDIVEFLIKPQWFVRCSKMAAQAVSNVQEGRLVIDPKNFEKVWFHWLGNVRDWCISRQLWWGQRIPAYFCECGLKSTWVVAESLETAKEKAALLLNVSKNDLKCVQDEDVLDTWFSSALQPFSVFGWPERTPDLTKYFPLSIMETGHDILFFWVARMVMLGTQLTGQLPFSEVFLHGIVCDVYGRKMSKSLGNVIAPEDVIQGASTEQLKASLESSFRSGILSQEELGKALEGQKKMFPKGIPECGADALRFTLLSHNVKSHVINFNISECYTNKLFGNKIWQATKFALLWIDKVSEVQGNAEFVRDEIGNETLMDRWILSKLANMIDSIECAMKMKQLGTATGALKQFLYYEFCDIYLEAIKVDLKEKTSDPVSKAHCKTLLICLNYGLKMLWPFMPALAQHLHQHLPNLWGLDRKLPQQFFIRDADLENDINEVMSVVIGIRRLKKLFGVTYKHKPEVFLEPSNVEVVNNFANVIQDLSSVYTLHLAVKPFESNVIEDMVGTNKIQLVVPQELLDNLKLDRKSMGIKKGKLVKELDRLNDVVSDKNYIAKSSHATKEFNEKRIAQLNEKITRIDLIVTFLDK